MEIKTIAIVGASELGRKVAYESVLAGYRTILEDVSLSSLEQGIAWIAQTLRADVSAGKFDTAARESAFLRIVPANSADAAREADLIIETVSDEVEVKIELFTIFDKFAKPGAIFASTTTSVSITDLAAVTFCPERCVGMRFFTDAQNAKRLELVRGSETSEATIAACREVGERMGVEIVVVRDEQEFATGCPDCGPACPADAPRET